MAEPIGPEGLRALLASDAQFALLDIRERGEFFRAHIPGATPLPRGDLEGRIGRLVARRDLLVILCCDDGRRSALAAATLAQLGYARVGVLDGGLAAWAAAGLPLESGERMRGKLYGERVSVESGVPEITVAELLARQGQGELLYVLDTRTPEEFERGHLPGAFNVPGGQLPLAIEDLVAVRQATIVTCCAGRTRSLLGARALREMGLPRVYALTNGVLAWTAAGLPLAEGADAPRLPPIPPPPPAIAPPALRAALAGPSPPVVLDLRTLGRFAAGHVAGAHWVPRGLLELRVPALAPDRATPLVLCAADEAQAALAAATLGALGYADVRVLGGALPEEMGFPIDIEPSEADVSELIRLRGPAAVPPDALRRTMQEKMDIYQRVRAAQGRVQ